MGMENEVAKVEVMAASWYRCSFSSSTEQSQTHGYSMVPDWHRWTVKNVGNWQSFMIYCSVGRCMDPEFAIWCAGMMRREYSRCQRDSILSIFTTLLIPPWLATLQAQDPRTPQSPTNWSSLVVLLFFVLLFLVHTFELFYLHSHAKTFVYPTFLSMLSFPSQVMVYRLISTSLYLSFYSQTSFPLGPCVLWIVRGIEELSLRGTLTQWIVIFQVRKCLE